MSDTSITAPSLTFSDRLASSPSLLALVAVAFAFAVAAAMGFKMAQFGVDNDSQMRLVEVRDLLAGQGWFDTKQYRMGVPEGFVMHWSRLIDAPIAAIMLVASLVTGSQAAGEMVALVLWPALTFFAALYFVLRAVRAFAGDSAMVPATVITAITFYGIGIFAPGAIDHHNAQLALNIAVLAFLLESIHQPRRAFFAGVAGTLSLVVGMETAVYVAFAGISVAVWFLIKGERAASATIHFGLGFATAAIVALLVAKPPSSWFAAECDAYSIVQFTVAVLAGLGIAAVAGTNATRYSTMRRFVGLAAVGACVAAVLVIAFPQCLAEPYSDMPPRLRDYWMSTISEAQPIWAMLRGMPIIAANVYPPIFVALIWLLWRITRRGFRTEDGFVAAFLVSAALVACYQVRGANFGLGFAMLPLAAMVADARAGMDANSSVKANLRLIGAWLISINLVWMLGATLIVTKLQSSQAAEPAETESGLIVPGAGIVGCAHDDDYALLAAMPKARIVSGANLGAAILRLTSHHPYAGPYHRNITGNLIAFDMLSASPESGRAMALDNRIDLVVSCRSDASSSNFASGTLQSALNDGRTPSWLQIVPETAGRNLEVYRVVTN